ncbi:MAG: hydrogenase maturation protease [Bacteroidetes bacterium]|nr:hydrogenase maturation protease [Bacteroidota bacterium]
MLALGIGNYLMGDEGVGIHAVQALEKEDLPPHVDILDGGTGGFHLLGHLEAYPSVILIDATLDEQPPGTIRLIEPRFASDFPTALSAHDIGLKDLVETMILRESLPKIYLIIISVEDISELKVELSDAVEKAIPEVVNLVKKLIQKINV